MTEQAEVASKTETPEQLRDSIRAKIVGSTPKAASLILEVFDVRIEMRQPSLEEVLGKEIEGDMKAQTAFFVINYCYVPGTDIKIFEPADKPQILKWPFGKDYLKVQEAINDLMGIDIAAEETALNDDDVEKP